MDVLEQMWERSAAKDKERRRRALRAEWHAFYFRLAEAHAKIAAGFEEKAAALLEDDGKEPK